MGQTRCHCVRAIGLRSRLPRRCGAVSCTQTAFNTALTTAQSGGGTITSNCGGVATVPFTAQKLITSHVIIDGGGLITLSGGDVTRLFRVQNGRSLTLRNIILTDGFSGSDYGGAIYVENGGVLTVAGSTIQNSATNGWAGGAIIDFGGTVTLTDSVIANNQSSYGAINSVGTLTLLRTTIMSNTATIGGGGLSIGGDVTIQDSHLHHNSAPIGGALFSTAAADVSISGSTFSENSANGLILAETGGGAILSDGTLSIERSTFWGNVSDGSGGALQTGYQTNANTTSSQSAFFWNQAVLYGGAIYNQNGTMSLVNSTLSENITQESGGGLTSFLGPTTLIYVTAVNNPGGNLNQLAEAGNNDARQTINLNHTAVAGGADNCLITGSPAPDPLPYFFSQNNNLASDDSCILYLTAANDINTTPAMLNLLADNGGVTLTHLPEVGSPLVDAVPCQPDHLIDQRGITRPQNGLCDIGAVEVATEATGPTPTPLPTGTAVPTPTPMPTPTVPIPGAAAPAFNPIRITGGLHPTINLNVNHAYGGQEITVSGTGVAGSNKVRIFSIERGQTVGAVEAPVSNNTYQASLIIPYNMPVGLTQLCAAGGAANGELACKPFTIDPMPAGSVSGQIQGTAFSSWDAQAHLIDTRGRLVQTTPVNNSGAFQFNNIPPGVYQYAIGGRTSKPIRGGELIIGPASNVGINPLEGVDICLPGSRTSSYLLVDRGATNTPSDKYAQVVLTEFHPLIDKPFANIELNWEKFQRDKFGYYVSGVHRPENFKAIPQVDGPVQKVVFYLRNADGSLADNPPQTQNTAPYTAVFDMGKLQPSTALGDPYIEVVPYVNGSAQCPSTFLVQVLADPMKADIFRADSKTEWNSAANAYTFNGVTPDIPGLPVDFSIPSKPLDKIGQFVNQIDAGVYLTGFLTEDGVVRIDTISAQAVLKLLSVPLVDSKTIEQRPLPTADYALSQLKSISFTIPKDKNSAIQLIEPIELGMPFIETPIFSLFAVFAARGRDSNAVRVCRSRDDGWHRTGRFGERGGRVGV